MFGSRDSSADRVLSSLHFDVVRIPCLDLAVILKLEQFTGGTDTDYRGDHVHDRPTLKALRRLDHSGLHRATSGTRNGPDRGAAHPTFPHCVMHQDNSDKRNDACLLPVIVILW
jgi:hypothetical protein